MSLILSPKRHILWLVILLLIVIDQVIKIQVKTNMCLYESISITNWFYISFVENNGMAFGMTFLNKVVLSLFRIVVSGVLAVYLYKQIKQKAKYGYCLCLSLIIAGAIGNIIDCMFYGLIFTESQPFAVSSFVPFGTGYAPFLLGRVVDMFYFPIIDTNWPDWIPFIGGKHFVFFSPVFNFADSCVSVGFISLLLFYRSELRIALESKGNDVADEKK